jgi:UDP-N-acetylmuramoyl-tripeptide--D-alanyl-D-alanine ligase
MDDAVQVGIVEMGANHPGEIRFLCGIAQPDCGLITNIGKAHLEGFGGIEGVARGKGELFSYLAGQGKTLIVNQGDERIMELLPDGSGEMVFYNGNKGLEMGRTLSNPFLEVEALAGDRTLNLRTQLVGSYNVENVLAACCVGITLDVPDEDIVNAIQDYRPQAYRSQYIRSVRNKIFMDAYNANPSSMMAAIREFLAWKEENKLLILGEMKEVGKGSDKEHQYIVSYLKDCGHPEVICVGKAFESPALNAGYRHFEDVASLKEYLERHPVEQKLVFVKGSRSNRLEVLLDLL